VYGLAGTSSDTWIGANDISTHLTYEWNDGATFGYDAWFTNRPKDNADQDCVKIRKADGAWDNIACTKEIQYACSKTANTC